MSLHALHQQVDQFKVKTKQQEIEIDQLRATIKQMVIRIDHYITCVQ